MKSLREINIKNKLLKKNQIKRDFIVNILKFSSPYSTSILPACT